MTDEEITNWLLSGDPSIAYQCRRDLLKDDCPDLQARIATEGWGKKFLDCRNADGGWGDAFYQPRWACTHYTLLTLRTLCFPPEHDDIRALVAQLYPLLQRPDGGIGTSAADRKSDVCVNGTYLNYASYFGAPAHHLEPVIDFILDEHMPDGGFNCRSNRSGAAHSSMHSTLSVLEGFHRYLTNGGKHRRDTVRYAMRTAERFLLQHRLYRSDRTGQVINSAFLRFSIPAHWRYNVLRALDYFQASGHPLDARMLDAVEVILTRRITQRVWRREAAHPGKTFFVLEPAREPSRLTTLLALRVLQSYPSSRLD